MNKKASMIRIIKDNLESQKIIINKVHFFPPKFLDMNREKKIENQIWG